MNKNLVIIYRDLGRMSQSSFSFDDVYYWGNLENKEYEKIRILEHEEYINNPEKYDSIFKEKDYEVKLITLTP